MASTASRWVEVHDGLGWIPRREALETLRSLEARDCHRELNGLFTAEHGDAQVLAGPEGLERLDDLGAIFAAGQLDPLDREQDVAPDNDLLSVHDADSVSALEP